jgi:ADP-heptose:LPS heptosyltransferase
MDLATMAHRRILVIRLGALGNIVQSLGPFAAIRAHHPDAEITLLTLKPYANWMRSAPWFDRVWIDEQPAWWDLPGLLRLRRRLIAGQFDRVYDLQTSRRSNRYFKFFPRNNRPEWSGIAPGCSHPDADSNRNRLHDLVRQPNQLRQAGIAHTPPADLSWCTGDIARFDLPRHGRIVLLVPGCSPTRPGKRWPVQHYAALAAEFVRRGVTPVVIGTESERDLGRAIHDAVPETVDLTGRTSLGDVADLGRAAVGAVGNDTGPMHLIAATGCRCVAIFSHDSDPALCAPGGADVRVLRRQYLATLTPAEVLAAFDAGASVPGN